METWVEEIEGWDDQPFSGGYGGLHDLAAGDFSGAVSAGGTWLFMVNGRVVAVVEYRQTRDGNEVVDAGIERFEDASGTAYAAPAPSIPLLVAMKTRDGETRGSYYSVKTPIDEVAATLEEGGFTGYVELSENVLSGDYYTVYQAGRSMDLAFIGNARRLLTDEEAHERMVDEVGIYEVVAVDLDVVEIPGDGDTGAGAVGAGAAGTATAGASAAGRADADSTEWATGTADDEPATPEAAVSEVESSTSSAEGPVATSEPADEASAPDAAELTSDEGAPAGTDDAEPAEPEPDPAAEAAEKEPAETDTGETATASPTEEVATRAVPSLDPDRSSLASESASEPTPADPPVDATADADRAVAGPTPTAAPDEMADLREELRAAREKLADVREDLAATKEERDELAATVEELRARIRELEAGAPGDGPSLTAAEALAGTNLFVRYASKSNLTVADAHDGAGDRDELLENLQLTHHTQFESEGATVDGQPFEEWLRGSGRFRFAQWLVTTLVFEIRETGSVDGLRGLYDGIPGIDRVELDGSVGVADEDAEHEVGFDLVFRDRMGEPLVVATLEHSREPVSEQSMATLVNDATAVLESYESLVGAFYVTSAFFAPEALETAREATSGSLLSRDRRKSYVKLSRNRGYHLGLVESREETFHLSVPDL